MKTTSFEMAFIIRVFMQDVENFYRCLVSDASSRGLLKKSGISSPTTPWMTRSAFSALRPSST